MRSPLDVMTEDIMAAEVRWYKQNGKYPERITTDSRGRAFVVGDRDWNRRHRKKMEYIEDEMNANLSFT